MNGGTQIPRCAYCGDLAWTKTDRAQNGGRVTHKHGCPHRTDKHCQTHPAGCPDE